MLGRTGTTCLWVDPALYISLAALGLSTYQFIRSIRIEARTKRRIEFIEFIAGKFSGIDAAMDALELKLRKANSDATIRSAHILDVAHPAVKELNRALTAVSIMPAVSKDLVDASEADKLDHILNMVDNRDFDGPNRNLSISTALNIVTQVAAKCSAVQRDVQSVHLD